MSWGELLFVDGLTPEQREMFNKLKPVAAGYQREVAEREPAQRTTELARRRGLQACRAIEADLGAISPGRAAGRLAAATATAGLRKASELFKHSCPILMCNEPTR